MTRSREPSTTAYDILGVSRDSNAEEIEKAFQHLNGDHGAERAGVPVREQEKRAEQIQKAYATLSDPVTRRAYDESLTGEQRLWPASAKDEGADALVRPARKRQKPRPAPRAASDPIDPPGSAPTQAFPVTYARLSELLVPPEKPRRGRRKASGPPLALDSANPSQPPAAKPVESAGDEVIPIVDKRPLWPGHIFPPIKWETFRGGARVIVAAAATVALGALALFLSWPGEKLPPPTRKAAAPPLVAPATSTAEKPRQPVQSPPIGGRAPAEKQTEAHRPSTVPPDTLDQFLGRVATGGAVATPKASKTTPAAQAQPSAVAATRGPAESAPSGSPAPGQVPPVARVIEVPARVAPPVHAQPAGGPAPSIPLGVAPPAVSAQPQGLIRVPARWLGGGPTNSDNRHGRYVGTVIVQFTVRPDGRASNCVTARGSGNADLDSTTCRLVEQRARFEPALDAQNRPVASKAHAVYNWGRRRPRFNLGRPFGRK